MPANSRSYFSKEDIFGISYGGRKIFIISFSYRRMAFQASALSSRSAAAAEHGAQKKGVGFPWNRLNRGIIGDRHSAYSRSDFNAKTAVSL